MKKGCLFFFGPIRQISLVSLIHSVPFVDGSASPLTATASLMA
jgi:hypothetical protein